jgi:glycine/D-amino acid oxidase-like deaminating enzyme
MLSWWEQDALTRRHVAVVGAGLVGLSTACSLLERHPGLDVLVLERGTLPTGASTRSAGFACYGSASEILADIDAEGPERAAALVQERWLGLARLRARLGDKELEYEDAPGYDLLRPEQLGVLDRLGELNRLLKPVLGHAPFDAFHDGPTLLGFPRSRVPAMVRSRGEGLLHPGRMMRALLARAQRLGATVLHGVEVERLEPHYTGVLLHVRHRPLDHAFAFDAAFVGVTTNAFARQLLPALDVVPGRGQVLLTAPVPGQNPLRGSFHCDEGDLYFRDVGERVLLGGGRHTDVAGETTTAIETTASIQAYLERFLGEVVLPDREVTIESRWAGIMAFGRERAPIERRITPHLAVGVRMSGMGVAIGSRVGDRLAEMLLG